MNAFVNPVDQRPLRVGVAGAGAIGCTLAALLARAGAAVHVLARGASLTSLRRDGVRLRRQGQCLQAAVVASDDAHALGPQDVLFLCAKAQDVARLLQAALPMVGPQTCVVPLVNGVPWWYFQALPGPWQGRAVRAVDADGALLALLPVAQIAGAVVFITAERLGPGEVLSDNPLLLVLGELDHSLQSDRLQRIAVWLERAGIEARIAPQIRDTLWTKVLANLTSNPLSVIAGATLQNIYGDARLQPIVRQMLQEGLALAAACGARIAFAPASFMAEGAAMGEVRTSMLQDFEAGRSLELAAIGDAVLELARLQGMAMPVTERVIALAHFRDEARSAHADAAAREPATSMTTTMTITDRIQEVSP
ncbi:2-dehydropantoate 2-reductase [Corticibacter populi]|uniref:2-dehydropantoate 2-reductase n=1 Tax=Corticibacter populi TaxID=1550736 RepID=A0A3M6QX79_9BURK|nr:2-dehydropantoate 2-reductase [Corticibacter populi]RMX07608.1 2-dehydropantoate 2-reductase [Corticibacter populi]RZS30107.1 ketopantoate reductase [Corticibacter populi]